MVPSHRIIFFVFIIASAFVSCRPVNAPTPDCDIQRGPCMKTIGSVKVMFDLQPKPVVPMKELRFIVETENLPVHPERLIIDLTMPGMEMGINQVVLERTDGGVFAGKGVIVKCPKGAKLWKAEVWIPKFGEVEYLFIVQ